MAEEIKLPPDEVSRKPLPGELDEERNTNGAKAARAAKIAAIIVEWRNRRIYNSHIAHDAETINSLKDALADLEKRLIEGVA